MYFRYHIVTIVNTYCFCYFTRQVLILLQDKCLLRFTPAGEVEAHLILVKCMGLS